MLDDTVGAHPFFAREGGETLTSAWLPPVDILEGNDEWKIVAEVAGVRPEDVKISLENDLLTIRGEKKQVANEQGAQLYRFERSYGTFERAFTLPTTLDAERIKAAYDNGVLTVTLPKAERARPHEIPVTTA
jgi:HSP20 family protein